MMLTILSLGIVCLKRAFCWNRLEPGLAHRVATAKPHAPCNHLRVSKSPGCLSLESTINTRRRYHPSPPRCSEKAVFLIAYFTRGAVLSNAFPVSCHSKAILRTLGLPSGSFSPASLRVASQLRFYPRVRALCPAVDFPFLARRAGGRTGGLAKVLLDYISTG